MIFWEAREALAPRSFALNQSSVVELRSSPFRLDDLISRRFMTHRIHGTGIFTYVYHKNQPNVGKYTIYIDPMGEDLKTKELISKTTTEIKAMLKVHFLK